MPKIDKLATENLTVAIFRMHSTKDDVASKKAGRPIYVDMEVCELRFAANRQTVGVFPAHEIFKWNDDAETGEREPLTYALAYPEQYRKFKNGEAQVASGTPLSELPFLTQGKRLELKALNIHTAEALAALDGTPLKQLGQGGRTLKEQAQAYIDKAAGTADVSSYAAENVELKRRLAALEAKVSASTAKPVTATATSAAASDDDVGTAGDDAVGEGEDDDFEAGEGPGKEGDSPFFVMAAEDIVNWLKETTGKKPRAGTSHAALVKLADEVNAALAEKAKGTEAAA
ncbi:hypothetical protein HNQ36_001077 [Afipia massiliensis]|uniref:Uncharacterized protein n=1 Tax=Afipia massiliensis TaxID=211460 RepID=A0A840MT53_9BRAD|nr:hypothetical protein [Afipia massiliensis]MBB5051123.1 hypothetical protein [Afipia massiliensis]